MNIIKKTSRICAELLSLTFLLAACDGATEAKTSLKESDVEVWCCDSLTTVKQEETSALGEKSSVLVFAGVKNEYESAQIVINAKADVAKYDLDVAALKDADGNTIAANRFSVYREHYVPVEYSQNVNSPYEKGSYPDALIPLDLAEQADELNIRKDCNQAIWVTVEIPKDAVAGVYTGTFLLTLDGVEKRIPVQLTVYDAVLSDASTMQSLFLMNSEYTFTYGELDCTTDMMRVYYDFLLDYRLNAYNIPVETVTDISVFVEAVKGYYDNPKVTTYGLPNNSKGSGGVFDNVLAKEQVLALARASESGKNYLSKLVIKNGDETDYVDTLTDGTWEANIAKNKNLRLQLKAAAEEVRVNENGAYDGYIANFADAEQAAIAVENISIVDPLCYAATYLTAYNDDPENPQTREGEYLDYINVWCPKTDILSDEYRDAVFVAAEKYGAKKWWYTANNPTWPTPTYHIDTNPISARVLSWMQRAYGIEGNLYWAVCCGSKVNDVYTDTALKSPAGDGYLLYPGAKYRHNGPLPSIRLMRIRDGLEDYELLGELEDKYENFAAAHGIVEYDAESATDTLYDRIFVSCAVYDDTEAFAEVAAQLRLALSGQDKIFISSVEKGDESVKVTFYADAQTNVSGAVESGVVGDLKKYECVLPRGTQAVTMNLTIDGKEYGRFICTGKEKLTCSADNLTGGSYSCTTGSTVQAIGDEYVLSFVGDTSSLIFEPSVNLKISVFGKEHLAVCNDQVLKITLYNPTEEDIEEVRLWFYNTDGARKEIGNYYLRKNAETVLTLRLDTLGDKYKKLSELRFQLKNFEGTKRIIVKEVAFETV